MCHHKLSFGTATCNGGLVAGLVGNGATGESVAKSGDGPAVRDIRGSVGVKTAVKHVGRKLIDVMDKKIRW